MTLKALLMGSAAAMIAVSGAKAADAVVAEPEAVEYVRVCDAYGAGFYFIPGTETCLKISGYVRVDYSYNDRENAQLPRVDDGDSTWEYRARINFEARNETDYGTLMSQLRIQGDSDGGSDADTGFDRALIGLGGFRLGYTDSYTTTLHGYGHQGIEKYDGGASYFYDQAILLDYTYAANGFSATVGIQDSVGNSGVSTNEFTDIEYYVGGSYTNSMFTLAASYLHEDEAGEGTYKVSAIVKPMDGLSFKGWYMGSTDVGTRTMGNTDFAWGIGANYQATDTLSLAAAYSDVDAGEYAITVGAIWNAAPGLSVRPNVQFRENTGESYSVRVYRTF